MSISDDLSSAKYALNSTIGQGDFKPLDKMIKEEGGKISEKYLALKDDLDAVSVRVTTAQNTANTAQSIANAKAPKASPVFTGSISMGRKANTTVGANSIAVGLDAIASGKYSFAVGERVVAQGDWSHAEGSGTTASGDQSHAEGVDTTASGEAAHAEGTDTTASGEAAHAEGSGTTASGDQSHAEGADTTASGVVAHAEGWNAIAEGRCSHAGGFFTTAKGENQTAIGQYNVISSDKSDVLIIGKGVSNGRSNCFRVTHTGVYASGNYNASGADYAEYFEWADGNLNNEDRIGLFVTLDGDKIKIATPEDDYIVGVISGAASVVGDAHDDQWSKMYLKDVFGRPIWETVEIPDEVDEEGNIIIPAHTVTREKLNPDYDNTKAYIKRSERPEWDIVGIMGKLIVIDDASCEVNGWAAVGIGGIAVKSDIKTKYRVMSRIDENHIKILML